MGEQDGCSITSKMGGGSSFHLNSFHNKGVDSMAITQYGSDTLIPDTYKPFRGIATDAGFYNDDIGYDAETKSPTLMGTKFDPSQYMLGSDQRYYADPNVVNSQIYAAGLKPTAPQSYVSPYQTQIQGSIDKMTNYMNTPFQYNPATDTALQQAQKQAQESTMAQTNARGLLNSTITTDRMAQNTAMLIPQYEQIAYGRWQDEGSRLMQFANFFQGLDDSNYQRFTNQWEMETKARNDAYQRKQDEIANTQRALENAYSKLEALDYVDNEIAKITGLPVGMQSISAQRRLQDRQWQIEDEARALQQEKELNDYRTRNEIKVINARGESGATSGMGTPEQQEAYNLYYENFLGDGVDSVYMNNPVDALNLLIANRNAIEADIGTALYEQLYKQVEAKAKMNKTYATKETDTSLGASDYKTDPDFAEDVHDAMNDKENFKAYFDANTEAFLQKYGVDGYNYLYNLLNN
jgi:hypothetical protein